MPPGMRGLAAPLDRPLPTAYASAIFSLYRQGPIAMKRISISIALVALVLLLGLQVEGKPVPKSLEKLPAKIDDKVALQGDWIMEYLEQRGVQSETGFKVTVKGDQWILYSVAADGKGMSRTIRIDSSKSPKTFDLVSQGKDIEL